MLLFFEDNVVISLSAATFNGSEMDGSIQICAEVLFGIVEKNITVSFLPLETGEGEGFSVLQKFRGPVPYCITLIFYSLQNFYSLLAIHC